MNPRIAIILVITVFGIGLLIGCQHMSSAKKLTLIESTKYELPATPDLVIKKVASLETIVYSQKEYKTIFVQVKLLPADAEKFTEFTGNHIKDRMLICVDKKVLEQPVVNEKITGGQFAIFTKDKTKEEANELIRKIRGKKIELYFVKR